MYSEGVILYLNLTKLSQFTRITYSAMNNNILLDLSPAYAEVIFYLSQEYFNDFSKQL